MTTTEKRLLVSTHLWGCSTQDYRTPLRWLQLCYQVRPHTPWVYMLNHYNGQGLSRPTYLGRGSSRHKGGARHQAHHHLSSRQACRPVTVGGPRLKVPAGGGGGGGSEVGGRAWASAQSQQKAEMQVKHRCPGLHCQPLQVMCWADSGSAR
jgi:hypothetical protein